MPKSKRNKQIELAKTKKRGFEWKKSLYEKIRSCVDSYTNVYVFTVNDMRNSKMKNVREQWKHSRFFIGKNKIMAMALGRFTEEEYKPNLHKIGKQIKGQRGLLFSNKSTEEVLSWFRSYSEGDYARSGNTATEDVKLSAGPLAQFPHSLEPYLRQLGLPTSLVKGVIHLVKDHEVCKAGDILAPETAKILKLLDYEMAEFHIIINCMWTQDYTFVQFTEDIDTDAKENLKKNKKKKSDSSNSKVIFNSSDIEKMEIEDDINVPDLSESEHEEGTCNTSKAMVENEMKSNKSPAKLFSNNSYTPKKRSDVLKENDEIIENISIGVSEKEGFIEYIQGTSNNFKKMKTVQPIKSVEEESEESDSRQSQSCTRKVNTKKSAMGNDSLLMTPDNANTSQDSPIFRELRNRSVKIGKKNK